MKGLSTQTGLNFIKNYDQNKDGLSKPELQNGKMNSCLGAMKSLLTDDKKGFSSAMKDLQFASAAEQNFDFLSQASKTTPFGDNNPQTINPLDLMKTASNDGNVRNLTPKDIKSQKQQNAQQSQDPMMQMMQKFLQAMMQMLCKDEQQTNKAPCFATTKSDNTDTNNNGATAFAMAFATGDSASAFASASTEANKNKFLM